MRLIVLKTRAEDACVGVIRLTPEAEKMARRLHSKCGPPIRQIVSEITIQSENLITDFAEKGISLCVFVKTFCDMPFPYSSL
jgi:hypothetical protein